MTNALVAARPANGVERAALVLLALGEAHGAKVWAQFSDEEAASLASAIARLGKVETLHANAALTVFANELSKASGISGNSSTAEALIAKVMPEERVAPVLDRLRRPGGPGLWDQLAQLDDAIIAGYLEKEHPQTTALVLSRMPSARAAAIVAALQPDTAIAALSRLSRLQDTDNEALAALESTLSENLIAEHIGEKKPDPALKIASIFDAVDQRQATVLLEAWSSREADTATRVRELMFTFEDFSQTPDAAIQVLLKGLDRDVLALALKGSSQEVRTRFLDQMSARAARMVEDQMTSRGPVRRKDIVAAQAKIVAMARELEKAEELKLRKPPEGQADTEEMVE